VLEVLGVGTVVPHESTIRRLLQQIDPAALEAALPAWALPNSPRARRRRTVRR
jgi:hypothetical protein